MVPHNSVDDLDILLELASRKKEVRTNNPEVDLFIKEFKVRSGKSKIPSSLIYYAYWHWKQKDQLSIRHFFVYFKKQFKLHKTTTHNAYLLDEKSFDLDPRIIYKAKALVRREREKGKSKTKA